LNVAGAVLAGGLGRRMAPDPKPGVMLGAEPLLSRPIAALLEVSAPVAVVCKRSTPLPALPAGVERWDEPDAPRHPLVGIVFALERAQGPVLFCAADMPYVDAAACRALLETFEDVGHPVVASSGGRLQPVFGVYVPDGLAVLRAARPDAPLTDTIHALSPATVELPAEVLTSVDTPDDLARAQASLRPSG
jgi:molybdopterin-guanine dinucleotide biosynthesis protein A